VFFIFFAGGVFVYKNDSSVTLQKFCDFTHMKCIYSDIYLHLSVLC